MEDTQQLSPVVGSPDQSAEATNAVILNQQVGKLVDALGQSGTDVVAAIDAITAAVVASIIGGSTGTVDNRLLRAKGTGGRALENSPVACDDSGNLTGANSIVLASNTAYTVLCGGTTTANPIQSVASVGTAGFVLTSNGTGALPTFQSAVITYVDAIAGVILVPANQDYIVSINTPFAFTADAMTTQSASGTCTLVTLKNTTAIGGLSNSVSSSKVVATATSGNSFVAGDDVRLRVSSNSSCQNLAFSLKITRSIP